MPEKINTEPRRKQAGLLRRLLRNRSGSVGLMLVTVFIVVGLLGGLGVTPHKSLEQHPKDRFKPPSQTYLMGTDQFGRDVASRIMEGAWNSLQVAALSVVLATTVGLVIGTVAGFLGGWADNLLMRLMDIFFALPALLLALMIVTVLGPGLLSTVIAITIVYTPIFSRVTRSPVLSVKEMEYITAARCLGVPEWRILLRHVLPNTLAPLIVQVSLALSWALLTEAGLSFLGLGTQPPRASWGVMLSDSRGIAELAPWLMLFPGLAIVLGVLGFNLLGDGLRDILDPRLRGLR
jgi:peptide/nickel transport system permease protein